MELIIAGQCFAVLKIEEVTLQQLHLTLDRAPQFKPRKEPVMILVDGPNHVPVKLIQAAEGARLTVRRIYYEGAKMGRFVCALCAFFASPLEMAPSRGNNTRERILK